MTNEFKIISEDGLKTLCKAIKKTSTIGEIIDDDNSVTDKTYSSFEIDRRLNTKIDKTQLTTVLDENVTDEQIASGKAIYNAIKANESYSLDEQLTGGTWVDGKPIYRKTIFIKSIAANTRGEYDITLLNMDTFIRGYGTGNFDTETGMNVTVPYSDGNYSSSIFINKAENKFYIASRQKSTCNVYATFEYTKTTD